MKGALATQGPKLAYPDGREYYVNNLQVYRTPRDRNILHTCLLECTETRGAGEWVLFRIFLHRVLFELSEIDDTWPAVRAYAVGQVALWLDRHPLWIGRGTGEVCLHCDGRRPEVYIP